MSNVVPFFENVDPDFKATETVGSFSSTNRANSFDSVYTEACDNMLRIHNTKLIYKQLLQSPFVKAILHFIK